jgi:hypothetical protein
MIDLSKIKILGVHPIEPNDELVEETLRIRKGYKLGGMELELARQEIRNDFKSLYMIEIEINPPDASFDWCAITQPVPGRPRSDWQVPYDERPVDQKPGRWAFFFHFLDLDRPLQTPIGDMQLPRATSRPSYLLNFEYESP